MKPYYESKLIQIFHADFFSAVGKYPEGTFDCVITDPAYWTLDKWRNVGTTTRLGGHSDKSKQSGWFDTINQDGLQSLLVETWRVLKRNSHAYIMSDGQTLRWLLAMAHDADYHWSNVKPIVWDKVNQGMGYHFRSRHEYFVMLDKGKNRRLNSLSTPDVWQVPMIRGGYPTEKPVALMDIPILHSTDRGDLIFDPFMGGGSTLVSAERHGRRAVGFDISEKACEYAARRLSTELHLA